MYLKVAGYMTVVAIAAKLILFLIGLPQQDMTMYTIFINLFVILVGTYFVIRGHKIKRPDSDFKSEFKAGMRASSLFALLMSVFVLVYYNYIDTHFFQNMINDHMAKVQEGMLVNPDLNPENELEVAELLFSLRLHATLTLFGLTAVGAVYSLLLVIITRKIYKLG